MSIKLLGENFRIDLAGLVEINPNPSKGRADKKLGGGLQVLSDAAQQIDLGGPVTRVDEALEDISPGAQINQGRVVIDAVAVNGQAGALLNALRGLGLEESARFGNVVSGLMPVENLDAASKLSSLSFMGQAVAVTNIGAVTSQGAASMMSDDASLIFGIDGSGQTVGVLSDSFDNGGPGSYAADIITGDLPAGITILDDSISGSDEGRGMAQLIADVAPGAAQQFHTAFAGSANFAQGIVDLANAGSTVIVDDVGYLTQPFFQDGIIAQAVDQVFAMGVPYFSSAGNSARNAHEQAYNDSGISAAGLTNLHDFDGTGDIVQEFQVLAGQTATFSFQWDEPHAQTGGAGSGSDVDFLIISNGAVLNNTGLTSVGTVTGGTDGNIGNNAVEFVTIQNNTASDQIYGIAIGVFSGPVPDLIKYNITNVNAINDFQASGSSFGHPNAEGGLGVGAAFYQDTPDFGTSPPQIENFSSAGGPAGGDSTPILFDTAGNRLGTPEIRERVDIVAPDGTDTSFFGSGDVENNGFPNFFGTSAAAPHLAAVAALMLEANPNLTPTEIYNAMRNTAIDMDDPGTAGFDNGYDNLTGHGFIDALAAISSVASLDDFAGNTSTTGTVAIGGSTNGNIETASDQDWFAVTLQAGETYQFDATSTGLNDPFLRLRDDTGAILTQNNNGGPGSDARITFEASQSGTFFLAVNEAGFDATGTYEVSATQTSGFNALSFADLLDEDPAAPEPASQATDFAVADAGIDLHNLVVEDTII